MHNPIFNLMLCVVSQSNTLIDRKGSLPAESYPVIRILKLESYYNQQLTTSHKPLIYKEF